MMSDDGDVDIRVLALRRQQQRRRQSSNVLQENNTEGTTPYSSRVSSAYETTPVKTYASSASSSPARRSSYVGGLDEEARIGRMHVPPVIMCQCNGVESYALISTSETVSTISMDFVKKLRLMDQILPEISPVFNPLSLRQPELMGKVKYVDLAIGNNWQQVAQFNIIEAYLTDITLGIDFLRRTQSVLNFGDSVLLLGGREKISFLTSREVISLTKRNNRRPHRIIGTFPESE
ncbi:hypothetical protein JTE90_020781 [Oedothorax gibbosus]|uniref:Uncharacterized protein n=1 Tax=Oedothorax gibbosus TaxID=931172 RepID=A0AAV6TW54_9ARAC|nr:hypothetical protein JTE90_020781 [Oedothorax gibbosus]